MMHRPRRYWSLSLSQFTAFARPLSALIAMVGLSACSANSGDSGDAVSETAQAVTAGELADSCGYSISTQHIALGKKWGHIGEMTLERESGAPLKAFEVFADLGGASVDHVAGAEFEAVDGGYLFSNLAPKGRNVAAALERAMQKRPVYAFLYQSPDPFTSVTPYIISINGVVCDPIAPTVSLESSGTFYPSGGTLKLTATAEDNVAVRKVEFLRDGKVIGTDSAAPYELEVAISASDNGRHSYSAKAYDPTNNTAVSNSKSVLTSIGNKFLGTAIDTALDYTKATQYFSQITPGNAGKWGTVEATRDQMNFTNLDTAYQFAKQNQLTFKLHTLVWGQQQPGWLTGLSPEEQLAEIEQWFAAAAERYPDAQLVDVVNEPLHAVPSYAAALGGAGATGWDWVIKAFELARKYFPKSELILNDYNILILPSATADYLKIINVLKERGLIDGIGLQSHFLERAEMSVVSSDLDALAATGLPIYISELDVNFANDARQAKRMSELFTLFWNHPSVVGVTHWGYLQGNMWRTDSYLLRSDGTERPAFAWMNCFRAGNTNCTIPEYVPTPRNGTAAGITLEAEDYDDAQGIVALGDVVAYTDAGDFESFDRVVFNSAWNSFSVTYAKGNQDAASLSIHLDSPDAAPIATVALPTTGSWSTSKTVTVPITGVTGEHRVYIRYGGSYGVGNIDRFAFTAPTQGTNVIANGTFESNTNGWFTWSGALSTTTERAHSGSQSLLVGSRTGNAPAATSLTGLVTRNTTYPVSFWVSIGNAASANVNLTTKTTCAGGSPAYAWIANPVTIADGQWVEVKGNLAVPDCDITELLLWAEGPGAGVNVYVDDVTVMAPSTNNLLADGNFETSAGSWFSWGAGTLAVTNTRAHGGTQSLGMTGRTGNAPIARSITALVTPGQSYQVSFWASITGAASANVNVTQKIQCEGESASYSWLANPVTIADGQWAELKGTLNVPNCTLADVMVFAEGPGAGVNLYLDDVSITK